MSETIISFEALRREESVEEKCWRMAGALVLVGPCRRWGVLLGSGGSFGRVVLVRVRGSSSIEASSSLVPGLPGVLGPGRVARVRWPAETRGAAVAVVVLVLVVIRRRGWRWRRRRGCQEEREEVEEAGVSGQRKAQMSWGRNCLMSTVLGGERLLTMDQPRRQYFARQLSLAELEW